MNKYFILTLIISCQLFAAKGQNISSKQSKIISGKIADLMQLQENCWNDGNLECFMDSYLKSDKLVFIGKSGPKYGWKTTLANYQKSYPDKRAMGKLKFEIISTDVLSGKSAFVIGKWALTRKDGDLSGHFTLLWKKIKGEWVIVADHSS